MIDDRFIVVGELGTGAMGVVYEAVDSVLDRHVAIKLCRSLGGVAQATRMWREAKAMARLSHPNVITVHHVGWYQGQIFIAMELVRGGTLKSWLRTPRGWEAVVDKYLQVARGLWAAHAEGLVHRDCKPDNVLLGEDGRVRVADFGIARAVESEADEESESGSSHVSVTASISEPRLTVTGCTIGTPGYAAPEQLVGGTADARADQFSLCVSMYEGLYGERPFGGDTVPELYGAIVEGRARRPPAGSAVPRWVHAVIERGLRPEPDDRFTSMEDLVAALEDDPRSARRRWLLGGLAVSVLGLTAYVSGSWGAAPDPCAEVGEPFEETWDASRAARVETSVMETAPSIGGATLARVTTAVDDFGRRWTAERVDACEATHRWAQQSEALLELRMTCLDQTLAELDAVLEVLEHADPDVVARADDLVESLTPLVSCADTEALRAQALLPAEAGARERARAIRTESSALVAAIRARCGDAELERARDLVARAESLADEPTLAEARLALGIVTRRLGRWDEARAALVAAHRGAAASGHARAAYDSALRLSGLVGHTKKSVDPGLDWLEVARGWRSRLSLPDDERGRSLLAQGQLLVAAERYEDAVEALAGATDDPSLPIGIRSELANTRGVALRRLRRDEEGEQELLRAVELVREGYGPGHPREADLLAELARARMERGEHDEALAGFRRVLALREQVYGPRAALVAHDRGDIANALRLQGHLPEALAEYEQALALMREQDGVDEAKQAILQANYANSLTQAERSEEGLQQGERALVLARGAFGADSSKVAQIRLNLAIAYDGAGRHREAVEHFRGAVTDLERLLGPTHPNLGMGLLGLGLALVALEQWEDAEVAIDRAAHVFEVSGGAESGPMSAEVWRVRARMARARQQPEAAIEGRRRVMELQREREPSSASLREATYRLGLELAHAGRHDEAVEIFERAHDLVLPTRAEPTREAEILWSLARSRWERRSSRRDAIAAAERALRLVPEDEEQWREEISAWLGSRREG